MVVVMVLVVVVVFVERSLEVLAGGETLPFLTGIDHRHLLLLILLPPLPLSNGWEGHLLGAAGTSSCSCKRKQDEGNISGDGERGGKGGMSERRRGGSWLGAASAVS